MSTAARMLYAGGLALPVDVHGEGLHWWIRTTLTVWDGTAHRLVRLDTMSDIGICWAISCAENQAREQIRKQRDEETQ